MLTHVYSMGQEPSKAECDTKDGNICVMFPEWWTDGPMQHGNKQSFVCPMNQQGTARVWIIWLRGNPRPGPWARQSRMNDTTRTYPCYTMEGTGDANHYYHCDQCARIRGRNPTSCVLGHLRAGSICCISPD